eukprot:375892-Hanusia_phi.AAC.1
MIALLMRASHPSIVLDFIHKHLLIPLSYMRRCAPLESSTPLYRLPCIVQLATTIDTCSAR